MRFTYPEKRGEAQTMVAHSKVVRLGPNHLDYVLVELSLLALQREEKKHMHTCIYNEKTCVLLGTPCLLRHVTLMCQNGEMGSLRPCREAASLGSCADDHRLFLMGFSYFKLW